MARRIAPTGEALEESASATSENQQEAAQEAKAESVVFIKNQLNEVVHMPNGGTYIFRQTRERHTDPELIAGLRAVAKRYGIFEK